MIDLSAHLDSWCSRVPDLAKVAELRWGLASQSVVSYPIDELRDLADIEEHSYWFAHRNRVIASVVKRHPPSGVVLDIGGGNGFVSLGLRDAGIPAIVVEPGEAGADTCARRHLPVVQAAFQDLVLPPESTDSAGLFDVLEHIEDDEGTLRGLHRILKPRGMLYLSVPAYAFLWSKDDAEAGHFRRYTLRDLDRKLSEAGFEVVYGTYVFAALVAPILLLRSVASRAGLSRPKKAIDPSDHRLPRGIAGDLLTSWFEREARTIEAGGRVSFGSSCLVAARRL